MFEQSYIAFSVGSSPCLVLSTDPEPLVCCFFFSFFSLLFSFFFHDGSEGRGNRRERERVHGIKNRI